MEKLYSLANYKGLSCSFSCTFLSHCSYSRRQKNAPFPFRSVLLAMNGQKKWRAVLPVLPVPFRPFCLLLNPSACARSNGSCLSGDPAHRRVCSLVPRPSPSSVRNARAQFNAGVEKRREKAWTNFTRDPRHRRHKCLTRNSVTYSVLAMRVYVYVQLETSSQRIFSS